MLDQIICENIREEAQEIKRRLSMKGQDVDETVICELLESLDPGHETDRTEYIINMITDNRDFDFQTPSDEAGPSVRVEYQVRNDAEKFPKLDFVNSSATSAETIDVSDSEDDRYEDVEDDRDESDMEYYYSLNNDDNLDQTTLSDNSPITKTRVNVDQGTAEAELLEENNNGVIYMKNSSHEKSSRLPESPKPGCSKDSDDRSHSLEEYCYSCDSDELHVDAKRIHALLPNIDYALICQTLGNNQLAKNRIELTLWDLLPEERPSPHLAIKRKCTPYDRRSVKYKRKSNFVLPERNNAADTTKPASEKEEERQACRARSEIKTIDGELRNTESAQSSANGTDDGMKMMDTTEVVTPATNTRVDATSNAMLAINVRKDTRDSEKSKSSLADGSRNEELSPSTMDYSAVPHKTEIERIPTATQSSTAVPSTAAVPRTLRNATQSTAVPSIVAQNPAAVPCMMVPKFTVPRTLRSVVSTPNAFLLHPPVLRPPRFHGFKGPPVVVSSSRQSAPILKPPKLKHVTDATQGSTTARDTINCAATKAANNTTDVAANNDLFYDHLNNIFQNELLLRRWPYSYVRPVVGDDATIVPPNETLSSARTEEMKAAEERSVSMVRSMPSFTQSLKLATSNPFLHTQSAETPIANNEPLNFDLMKDGSGEEKNTLGQRDDMTALQPYLTEEEKQNFMLSLDMKTSANKEKQRDTANNAGHEEIILNEKARKMYYKLIPMFPSVDTTYIKRLCQSYLTDARQLYDESILLQSLVEHLLDNGQKHPTVKKAEPLPMVNSNTYNLNEQYADLLGIFPEADPIYLRKVAEENYKDPEKIKEFVQSKLENPDYPTRAQYLAKKKITEQQKQYTTHFKIQQFLELFPDPFSHFENASRQCKFNPHAADFLKQHFSKTRVNTLLNTYSEHRHNLSLAAKALEALSPDMKTKRNHNRMMLTEDIPLLQECAFIQHKVALKKYLTELKDQEEKELQELKAKNELIECQCCFDNECMPSKCFTCEDGHIFCNACIVRSTEVILASGKAHVDCLLSCGSEFSLSVLQQVLPPTKFSILLCKRQEVEVMAAGLEGLVSCPFCYFASIPPPEDRVFRCLNPNCMKESCRLCKELSHVPLKCNEVKSDVARLYLEEKMTEALVRKCYKCGRTFFKEEGCNKMTCPCGAQMCYICDKPVTDYKHFQGQGVVESNLCPLWSDDRRMNAESVIKVCRETMRHIKEKNPQVDINVDALLPKIPPKVKGPHEDVALANVMPAHAERIARHNP